jgi:AAHS family 3-hydroxyphenylpropionic acid transporter
MMVALLVMMAAQGYVTTANSGAAAFYAIEFGLDDAGIARAFGWIALGSVGTLVLTRLIDRVGRRQLLLISVSGISVAALATAAAPSLALLIAAQIVLAAVSWTLLTTGAVVAAEELPAERRARGQAWVGAANTVGSGLSLVFVAIAAEQWGSWRWAWVIAATPLLALPLLIRSFPETLRFKNASERGEASQGRVLELFEKRYRRRSIGVLLPLFLASIAGTATFSWLLYHPERQLGLDPGLVTMVVILGGAAGLAGFPFGAYLANKLGRRRTLLFCGLSYVLANISYYWVPADFPLTPAIGLGGVFSVGTVMFSASTVAVRSITTELFPTRLRGTVVGATLALGSIASVLTQFATATLTEVLGSMVLAISVLSLVGLPGYVLLYILVPETAGVELEQASLEDTSWEK